MKILTYEELSRLNSFEERFEYLKLSGKIGSETFGFDRIFNQRFYNSTEWKRIRDHVIIRDNGCDLGVEGHDIFGRIIIHHMNPISMEDLAERSRFLLDPDFLICVSQDTHNAIHYSDKNLIVSGSTGRSKNDTCPWRH